MNRKLMSKAAAVLLVAVMVVSGSVLMASAENVSQSDVKSSSTIYVPDDHAKIQWAVDNATAGDTIIVRDGTYYENVVVDKQLTIKSENGYEHTTMDGGGNGDTMTITADNITIKGFTITGSGIYYPKAGLKIKSSGNTIISNNISNNYYYGIILESSSNNNTITQNNISNNEEGVYLNSSSNNTITQNNISDNDDDSIHLGSSSNNAINSNNIFSNGVGIYLESSNNNTIIQNNISKNGYGFYLYSSSNNNITDNAFTDNGLVVFSSYHNYVKNNTVNGEPLVYLEDKSGVKVGDAGQVILVSCDNIEIRNLNLSNTDIGIEFWNTTNSEITSNNIFKSLRGIVLYSSSNSNTIIQNNISNNEYGIDPYGSSNNIIYLNNFVDNFCNACPSSNTWNSTGKISYTYNGNEYESYLGNYWSDYGGSDSDGDGIGDTPYSIHGDNDSYPLMQPFENYLVKKSDLAVSQGDITYVNKTAKKIIRATVHNYGGKACSVNVSLKAIGDFVETRVKEVSSISAGGEATIEFVINPQFSVEFNRFDVTVDPETNHSDNKVGDIEEVDESNNHAYVRLIGLETFSQYNTFYKYTNLEGNDSVIVGGIAFKQRGDQISLLSGVNVTANVSGVERETFARTGPLGKVFFDFSGLEKGNHEIQFIARDMENHYLSPIITREVEVKVVDTEIELNMVPEQIPEDTVKPGWAEDFAFDLYEDGKEDYFVKKGGDVKVNIKLVAGDASFEDSWVLLDQMGYYHYGWPKVSFGEVNSLATPEKTIVTTVTNGERYAIPEQEVEWGTSWDNAKYDMSFYLSAVNPVVYLFFKDEDGKIHRALDQEAMEEARTGNSYVFPYSPDGVDSNTLTYSEGAVKGLQVATAFAEDINKRIIVRTCSAEEIVNMGKGVRTLHLISEGANAVSLGTEIYKTAEILDEPPSKSRQIHGFARWAGISSSVIGIGLALGASGPPGWVVGAGAAMSVGLDMLANHIEKEKKELEEAYNYDDNRFPLDILEKRKNSSLVFSLLSGKTVDFGTEFPWVDICFMNTQVSEKNLSVKVENMNENGYITGKESSNYRIDPGDFALHSNEASGEAEPGSYIVRYFVQSGDGSRRVTTQISNALGIQNVEFLKGGERKRLFRPGDELKVKLALRNYLDEEKDYELEIEVPKLNKEAEATGSLPPAEEDTKQLDWSIEVPEDAEEGWYDLDIVIHKEGVDSKVFDVCDGYRFYVGSDSIDLDAQVERSSSIGINASLTDHGGQPIQNANVTVRVTRPDGFATTLDLQENGLGNYSAVYKNDTLDGVYRVLLTASKEGYIGTYATTVFNEQNTSSLYIDNLNLPSSVRLNQPFSINGSLLNNGSKIEKATITLGTSNYVKFNNTTSNSKDLFIGEVGEGEVRDFEFNITPLTSGKLHLDFSVDAGKTLNTYSDKIDVLSSLEHDTRVSVDSSIKDVWEGDPANYRVSVENLGDFKEDVTINSSCESLIIDNSSFNLQPGMEKIVVVTVTPEESRSFNLTVKTPHSSDNLSLYCNVMENRSVIEGRPDSIEVTAHANESFSFNYTIEEIGEKLGMENLSIRVTGLNKTLTSINYSAGTFNLSKGEAKIFSIEGKLDSETSAGEYVGNIELKHEGQYLDTSVITLKVKDLSVTNFTYTPQNPVVNESIEFNASASYDPDGNIISYEWDFGDGNTTTTTNSTISHTYSSDGSYSVTLTVEDNDGLTNSTSKTITVYPIAVFFDTGSPSNSYPSISGTHYGTITPSGDINVTKLYTRPCAGTGGHTEYVHIYGNGINRSASWTDYGGDWHNVTFSTPFTLEAGKTYNYEIRTGSYPQIIHATSKNVTGGTITCTKFIDANGKEYNDWIPAIRLE